MTQTRKLRTGYQITDREEIKSILDNAAICRLGFSEQGIPYVIPINYGYTYENDIITLFFHSGREGRKLEIIKTNPIVCFEADTVQRLNPEEDPGGNAIKWESIIGTGTIEDVTDFDEKKFMLGNMMKIFKKYNPYYKPNPLTDSRIINIKMLKLVLDEFKAKRLHHI